MWEGLLSPRAHFVGAAVAFLIAGSATAFAEVEDIGRPAPTFPDGDGSPNLGLFREGHAFGDGWTTLNLSTSRGNFTSSSGEQKLISSLGAEAGTPADDQNGAGPDYELSADYSSSTLDGARFPATVTDFGSVDSLIQSGWMLFGDGDHADGFNFAPSGYGLSGPSNIDMFAEDGPRRRGSSHCLGDGSAAGVVRCETENDLGSFVTTNSGAADQFGHQSSNPPGPNAPMGGGYLSAAQILALEMIAAQNSFAMTWPWGAIQGTFPSDCGSCGVTPPLVGASTSDFVDTNWNPNSDPPLGIAVGIPLPPAVPEIPQWAMLLVGFGGLALLGRRRLRRSAHLLASQAAVLWQSQRLWQKRP
jgi:hypothetical protein